MWKLGRWSYIIHAIRSNTIHLVTFFSRTCFWICSKALFSLHNSLSLSFSKFLSHFLCVLLFALILPYICTIFIFRMCCPYTAEGLLIPSSSGFLTFMINGDFWGFLHCSGQSFINKCDCAKQLNLINAEVTVTLSRIFNRLHRKIMHFP